MSSWECADHDCGLVVDSSDMVKHFKENHPEQTALTLKYVKRITPQMLVRSGRFRLFSII